MPLTKVQGGLIESTNEPIILGVGSSTGTANQSLQVNGGAYFAGVGVATGSIGVGTAKPQGAIDIRTSPQWSGSNYGANLVIGGNRNNSIAILDSNNSNPWAILNGNGTLMFSQMPPLGNTSIGATFRALFDPNGNFLINSQSATGTASQPLQVTGGAYVSGSVGIGTTNPLSTLDVFGSTMLVGDNTTSAFNIYRRNTNSALVLSASNTLNGGANIELYGATAGGGAASAAYYDANAHIFRIADATQFVGSISSTTSYFNNVVQIGSATSTGTAAQTLQVTGGGYFSGRVAVGATLTVRQENFSPGIQAVGTSDNSWIGAFRFAAAATSSPILALGKSAGASVGTYTAVPAGHGLGAIIFHGTNVTGDPSNDSTSASISGISAGNFTATSTPGSLYFSTTPVNAVGPLDRMIISSTGNIGVNTTTDIAAIKFYVTQDGADQTTIGAAGNQSVPGGGQIISYSSNNAGTLSYGVLLGVSDTNSATWQCSFRNGVGAAGEHRFYSWTTLNGRYNTSGNWFKGDNTTTWSTTSDIRIKKNIKTLENGLNIITSLRPVEFDYKRNNKHEIGFIAQEYEQVLPEQVINDRAIEEDRQYIEEAVTEQLTDMNGDPLFDDNGDPVTTSYKKVKVISQNLVPYLVSAVKEQQAIIESLTARIQSLEDKTL